LPHWLTDRPREIHLTLEYMLDDWPAHGQLNSARVGVYGIAMADSVMLATAYRHRATLWTQDSGFEGLQGARYFASR
jgi:predicted nucleic acid-binding protein